MPIAPSYVYHDSETERHSAESEALFELLKSLPMEGTLRQRPYVELQQIETAAF
jgi:hypothetical protein